MICNKCKNDYDITFFNKSFNKKYNKFYYISCKNCCREYNKKYKTEINPEAYRKSKEKNKLKNKEYYREYNKIYQKERRKKDPLFRLCGLIRKAYLESFKKACLKKNNKYEEILGLEILEFRKYLLTTKPINLDEKECHIDHIIPLKVAFDLVDEEERFNKLMELNHYTNLRLISKKDNLKKGCKLNYII